MRVLLGREKDQVKVGVKRCENCCDTVGCNGSRQHVLMQACQGSWDSPSQNPARSLPANLTPL